MQHQRPTLRLALGGLALMVLAACSSLTVLVDVYRGPLANHEDVQLEQAIVMATASRPVLIEFRDRLEQEYRDGIGLEGDWKTSTWYRRKHISEPNWRGRAVESKAERSGGDHHPTSDEGRQSACENCAARDYFCSAQAIAINEILELFERPSSGLGRLEALAERARGDVKDAQTNWEYFCVGPGPDTVEVLRGLDSSSDLLSNEIRDDLISLLDYRSKARVWEKKDHAKNLISSILKHPALALQLSISGERWKEDSDRFSCLVGNATPDPASKDMAEEALGQWHDGFEAWWGAGEAGSNEKEENGQFRFRATWVFNQLADYQLARSLIKFAIGDAKVSQDDIDALVNGFVDVTASFDESRLTLDRLLDDSFEALLELLSLEDFEASKEAQHGFGQILDGTLQVISSERLRIAISMDGSALLGSLRRISSLPDYRHAIDSLESLSAGGAWTDESDQPTEDWRVLRELIVEGVLYPETLRSPGVGPHVDAARAQDSVLELKGLMEDFRQRLSAGEVDFEKQQLSAAGRNSAKARLSMPPTESGAVSEYEMAFSRDSQGIAAYSPLTRIDPDNERLDAALAGTESFKSLSGIDVLTRSALRSSRVDPGLDELITQFLKARIASDEVKAEGGDGSFALARVATRREQLMRSLIRFSEKLRAGAMLKFTVSPDTKYSEDDLRSAQLLEAVGQLLQFQLDEIEHQVDARADSIRRAGAVFEPYQEALKALYGEPDPKVCEELGIDPLGAIASYDSDFDSDGAIDLSDILDTVHDAILARKAGLAMEAAFCDKEMERKKLNDRITALDEAMKVVAGHRRDQAFLRPAFAYLRQSFFASDLQTQVGPSTSLDDTSRQGLSNFLDRRFWININRVKVNGWGNSGSVLVKDDVGNWYVKSMSSDPKEIFDTLKSGALLQVDSLVSAERAAEIARVVTQETGEPVNPGIEGENSTVEPVTTRKGLVLDTVVDKADAELEKVAMELTLEVQKLDDDLPGLWVSDWKEAKASAGLSEEQLLVLAGFLLRNFESKVPLELDPLVATTGSPGPTAPRRWVDAAGAFLMEARGEIKTGDSLQEDLLALKKSELAKVWSEWLERAQTNKILQRQKAVASAHSELRQAVGESGLSDDVKGKLPALPAQFAEELGSSGRWVAADGAGQEAKLLDLANASNREEWVAFNSEAAKLLELRGKGEALLGSDAWTEWSGALDGVADDTEGKGEVQAKRDALDEELKALDKALAAAFGALDDADRKAKDEQRLKAAEEGYEAAKLLHDLHKVLAPVDGKRSSSLDTLSEALFESNQKRIEGIASTAITGLKAYRDRLDYGMQLVEEPISAAP